MELLRLLLVYEDHLLYEPTAAEALHGQRVVNRMPITIMLDVTIGAVSGMSATATASVAPAVLG